MIKTIWKTGVQTTLTWLGLVVLAFVLFLVTLACRQLGRLARSPDGLLYAGLFVLGGAACFCVAGAIRVEP